MRFESCKSLRYVCGRAPLQNPLEELTALPQTPKLDDMDVGRRWEGRGKIGP